MRTTREGRFRRDNPSATPIHEFTHLCVEHIVKRYHLSFAEKESLVKRIDSILFPEIFDTGNRIDGTERQARLDMLANSLPARIEQRLEEVGHTF
jgi:hypothetical protein